MKRLGVVIGVAAMTVALGLSAAPAHADEDDGIGGHCNGQIDATCWYYSSQPPYYETCTLWINGCFVG